MTRRIFVVGYYGFGNAGDDAIGVATINQLQSLSKTIEITITTGGHSVFSDTNVRTIPFSLWSILRQIYVADQIIFTGGSHFHDRHARFIDGLKVFVFYLLLALSAKTLRKKVYLLGHGIGPLKNPVFRVLKSLVIGISDGVTVRDPPSKTAADGRWASVKLAFDVAILLDESRVLDRESDSTTVLGVSVTPAFAKYFNEAKHDDALINTLSSTIDKTEQNSNIDEVRIFVFHTGEFNDDRSLSERLKDNIETLDTQIICYCNDPIEFISEIGKSDFFVGMKYHSLVFAYLHRIPTAGISYHPKCQWFRDYVGYDPETTIDMQNAIDKPVTRELVSRLLAEPDSFRPVMSTNESKHLAEQNFNMINNDG
jgi:polysaccharide pyruvyl transferase CsaB